MPAMMEPEVITANLRSMGCPYPGGTPHATIWVEGYLAGLNEGKEIALAAIQDEFRERGNA